MGYESIIDDELDRQAKASGAYNNWTQADKIIAALESAGFCIMPMEPTGGMIEAGEHAIQWGAGQVYRHMRYVRPKD